MLTISVTLCISMLHDTANLDLHAVLHIGAPSMLGLTDPVVMDCGHGNSIFPGRLPKTELLAQHSNNSFFQSFRRVHVSLLYSDTRYLYLSKSLYERTSLTLKVIYINKTFTYLSITQLNKIERFRFSQHDSLRKVQKISSTRESNGNKITLFLYGVCVGPLVCFNKEIPHSLLYVFSRSLTNIKSI